MDIFPEEPLNLSAADGFGYFPANINQTLSGGRYTIVRKLGWGSRSSTWLAWEKKGEGDETLYWAIQVFTVAKSKEVEARLLPIFQNEIARATYDYPNLVTSFWERSVRGEHLCFVTSAYGVPFSDVVQGAANSGRAGLPVHVVQYTTSRILDILEALHRKKVMHSGVKLENVCFRAPTDEDDLQKYFTDSPPAEVYITDGIPIVRSQPLAHYKVEWDDPVDVVAIWMVLLSGYGHIQVSPYTLENGISYTSAPETLLGNPMCGLSTDIWMLGCLLFQLLTGNQLFTAAGTAAERLGEIRDVLQSSIPDAWLGDEVVQALPIANTSTPSLEQKLKQSKSLTEDEASEAYAFLRRCLVIDPASRASSRDLEQDDWVEEGARCACCYSGYALWEKPARMY
ncbi:kinase-like domain-containing protein [Ephemerocybe angulata]|uniref:non-specific serine/threonine protein kinase n=1 Tax=Ephemerocybe angulata TaxID=980116 RepID=A0A8H6M9I8_9AGAR|nr:kinase-like domain-containing protein [Tulosesus angulatus]